MNCTSFCLYHCVCQYLHFCCIVQLYRSIGSLPGLASVDPVDADVKDALAAMELEDEGDSRLNFFTQVFRSGDFPIYEDYAVHRNAEGTPYQIIVTK